MTELVRQQETFTLEPRNFQEAIHLAKIMASSDMVPKDYRGKPENVLVAVQMGREVGLSPMQAIQNIAVINGRPSVWGDAMLAICSSHPTCVDILEMNQDDCTSLRARVADAKKAGTPLQLSELQVAVLAKSEKLTAPYAICATKTTDRAVPVVRSFSIDDAKLANLWGKQGPWQQYPERMLQSRARSFCLRDAYSGPLRGLNSAEESQDIPQEPPKNVTPKTVQRSPSSPAVQAKQSAPVVVDAEFVSDEPAAAADPLDDLFARYRASLAKAETEAELVRIAREDWTWAPKDKPRAIEIYKEVGNELRRQLQQAQPEQPPWDEIEQQANAQAEASMRREPGSDG